MDKIIDRYWLKMHDANFHTGSLYDICIYICACTEINLLSDVIMFTNVIQHHPHRNSRALLGHYFGYRFLQTLVRTLAFSKRTSVDNINIFSSLHSILIQTLYGAN